MNRGFTLLELLITMALVAILAGLAWPSYATVMHRAQRNEARLALLQLQYRQELHYQDLHAYTDEPGTPRSAAGSYLLSIELDDEGQKYLAHARPDPSGRQARDAACAEFTVDETGRHGAVDAAGRDNSAACWP